MPVEKEQACKNKCRKSDGDSRVNLLEDDTLVLLALPLHRHRLEQGVAADAPLRQVVLQRDAPPLREDLHRVGLEPPREVVAPQL